jgi:hypothetical protein
MSLLLTRLMLRKRASPRRRRERRGGAEERGSRSKGSEVGRVAAGHFFGGFRRGFDAGVVAQNAIDERQDEATVVAPQAVASFIQRIQTRRIMQSQTQDIEAQALMLPPEDRARLLERLIASFEPKSPAQAAWMQLANRRRADVKSGHTVMVPGQEALDRVKARLA